MPDQVEPVSGENEQTLQAEIARLNKIIQALMNRAERNASIQGSDFNLFHTAITLEDQVRRRTGELEAARLENEKITRALRESENRNRLLVENSPMGIHEIGMDGRIISMNTAGLLMFGLKEERETKGSLYLNAVSAADRERIGELFAKAHTGETCHFEFKSSGLGGQIYKSCFVPIKNKNGGVEKLMGITEDFTERKKAEEKIRNLAFYDTLTQLPNRRLLNDRLVQAMAASKRNGRYGAVIFLDLDNFKPLNDTHGHDVGDLLLIEVAHRITRCVREMDTVARFGGDEFVVMLSELDENKELSMTQAGVVAEKIRTALAEPYLLTRKHEGAAETTVGHRCTSSIGVVLFVNHVASQEDTLKWADMAMYQAKEGGRNIIRFFDGQS
jgi:diguanylate cyclase (GGDEF)-like protein/PAS domain S-box-containing protein